MNRRMVLAGMASPLFGAGDKVRAGLIGAGGRGRFLTAEFKEIGVEMAAVCDVYEPNLAAGLKAASTGARPHTDYRRLLEDKSIDVVVIATPDHWHARMTIDAVEVGKDVYIEKPLAHTIEEGFQIIDAVRRTRRVVQVGTQRRSFDLFLDAKRVMHTSGMGAVKLVNSWWVNNVASLRKADLRGKLDWQQWLGPAPKRELSAERFFNWYWYWDYSGGLLVGQAAHIMDAIHWFLGVEYPTSVTCSAPAPNIAGAEIPETACLTAEYAGGRMAVFTLGYQAMRYAGALDQMKQFHGHKARFDVGRERYSLYREDPKAVELKPEIDVSRPGSFGSATRQHIRNFLECVRSRKDPNATVEMGQQTNVVLCMSMQSLREGRRLKWDSASRKVSHA